MFRMRSFVERGVAKGMTCRSQMAQAIRDLGSNSGRGMATVQAAVIAYFESHTISKFIAYSMATGNWSTTPHSNHSAGNSMAAAVAVKTGVLQQLTNFNASSVLSHVRRVCTPLDRVGRGSRPRQLHPSHLGYLCPVLGEPLATTKLLPSIGNTRGTSVWPHRPSVCTDNHILCIATQAQGIRPLLPGHVPAVRHGLPCFPRCSRGGHPGGRRHSRRVRPGGPIRPPQRGDSGKLQGPAGCG